MNIAAMAAELLTNAYQAHGRCMLACDCGAWNMAVDSDSLDSPDDRAKARELLEHARFDHGTPRIVVATVQTSILDTATLNNPDEATPIKAAPVKSRRNHNYRIATDEFADGRIKARGLGRINTERTYPAGTTHQQAAEKLARVIEGQRFNRVQCMVSIVMAGKAEWSVFVTL